MKLIRYHLDFGTTTACTKILMEETKRLGQGALKGSTRDSFLFNSLFSLKKSAYAAVSIDVYFIGIVKTNTEVFCKATIEGLTKDWTG